MKKSKLEKAQKSSISKVLPASFFYRPAIKVARELLGKYLVRRYRGKNIALMITETEAYTGPHDLASHAAKGLTPRTKVMFGPPGVWYVYFIYGMHWMLNAVTGKEGYPAAVLIRGTDEVEGPARLTAYLHIRRKFNGASIVSAQSLWIEDRGIVFPPRRIQKSPRIGVDYAGQKWSKRPYRFFVHR